MKKIEQYIEESNAIEEIYGPDEIQQSLRGWRYLSKLKKLTHYDICRLHKLVVLTQEDLIGSSKGKYRSMVSTNVRVGDHEAPHYSQVDDLMKEWLKDLPRMSPLIAHIRFEWIHPLVDGNGRVGRMLYWWHCELANVKPFLYEAKKKEKYFKLFAGNYIEALSANHWGIPQGDKYEVFVKTNKGVVKGYFAKKPTDKEIKKSVPEGLKFESIISIKEI